LKNLSRLLPGLRVSITFNAERATNKDMPNQNIVVLTAPSGAGKTTIAHRVLEAMPAMKFSVSATTRSPRPDETDGEDYHFLTPEEFRARIEAGGLLEYEEVYPDQFYGTLRSEVENRSEDGPVLLDIDVNGALNVKRSFGDEALVLFIAPPSLDELKRRLKGRGTENRESLQDRLDRVEQEMEKADDCDAVVVNDELDVAVEETLTRIRRFLGL
jgi:guanylate kinase